MFVNISDIATFYVYRYCFIDDLSFLKDPREYFPQESTKYCESADTWLDAISALFRRHGWEGDGRISIMWLPPFIPMAEENTSGFYAWVVKQKNNGFSFIACRHELPFTRLNLQNSDTAVWKGLYPEGMFRGHRKSLTNNVQTLIENLHRQFSVISQLEEDSELISEVILESAQGKLVQVLHGFLDDCYLGLLREVMTNGNRSGIKLRKSKVNINPAAYLPEDSDGDSDGWFTLRGLVSNMWQDYKFEPYPQKIDLLLKPIGATIADPVKQILKKHVLLRNAIQHNEGFIDEKLLSDLGSKSIKIRDQGKEKEYSRGRIALGKEEIELLARSLISFCSGIEKHIDERIPERSYAPR